MLFTDKLRDILYDRKIPILSFCRETGISREHLFYKKGSWKPKGHRRYIYMAIAYYLGMTVEELIEGTDAEIDWYGDCGI